MPTLDEIFASMPDEAASGTHELLVIDPDTRQIYVPDAEEIFGVEHDGNAETKYFQCPRYVGKGIDLAACFLRINYQNANGERDGYLVSDTTVNGEYIYFSWELSPKVTQYQGSVQFVLCASLPGSTKTNDWHTTLAQGKTLEGLEPDAEAVAAASSDVIAQLLALVAIQSDNVEAVGAAQVAKVQAEGKTQVEAVQTAAAQAEADALAEIEAKKQNALAEIPDDYTTMAAQVDTLTRSTAGAIVCQAEGTAIQVPDASDDFLPGLRLFGRSTQDGTPTPDNPVEIVNTPAPVVRVYGKNLVNCQDVHIESEPYFYHTIYTDFAPAIGEEYTLSMDIVCNVLPFHINIGCGSKGYNSDMSPKVSAMYSENGRISISFVWKLTEEQIAAGHTKLAFRVPRFANETTFTATISNIMLEHGGNMTDFEQYKAAQIINTASDLPGIPVSSGGNYTDADGQAWICDEVDLSRGVYVQRINIVGLEGATGIREERTNGTHRFAFSATVNPDFLPAKSIGGEYPAVCTALTPDFNVLGYNNVDNAITAYMLGGVYIRCDKYETVADLVAWAEGIGLRLAYVLAEPIERPLSEAELAAFAAMRSVKPTTTILNDSGAHMAVEYVADTKLYIDRKLAELVAALNA